MRWLIIYPSYEQLLQNNVKLQCVVQDKMMVGRYETLHLTIHRYTCTRHFHDVGRFLYETEIRPNSENNKVSVHKFDIEQEQKQKDLKKKKKKKKKNMNPCTHSNKNI